VAVAVAAVLVARVVRRHRGRRGCHNQLAIIIVGNEVVSVYKRAGAPGSDQYPFWNSIVEKKNTTLLSARTHSPPRRYCARAPPLATVWLGASLCGRLRVQQSMPPRRAERAAVHHARKGRIQCGADTTLAARAAAPSGRQAPRKRPPCSTVGIGRAPNVCRAYRPRLSPPLRLALEVWRTRQPLVVLSTV
jgi:hypothetical protein